MLTAQALKSHPEKWRGLLESVRGDLEPDEKVEILMRGVATSAARTFEPVYNRTKGRQGYVCAQVNPAKAAGMSPRPCFAVIMLGRLDDYLRDVAKDGRTSASESDIKQAGLTVTKQAYHIFKDRRYEAKLLIAALRGPHHVVGLAGGDQVMSIHPKIQEKLAGQELPREPAIHTPIPPDVISRLARISEFVMAYEPDGMSPEDFITFGLTQKTLTQFSEAGWSLLNHLDILPV
ncbi:MAG: hypothetical protein HYX78_07170 [Armatimonadetes bacterium]|nr:hypothetical protein [Armatimonadota bacterium]